THEEGIAGFGSLINAGDKITLLRIPDRGCSTVQDTAIELTECADIAIDLRMQDTHLQIDLPVIEVTFPRTYQTEDLRREETIVMEIVGSTFENVKPGDFWDVTKFMVFRMKYPEDNRKNVVIDHRVPRLFT